MPGVPNVYRPTFTAKKAAENAAETCVMCNNLEEFNMKNITITKLKNSLSGKSENEFLEEIVNLFKKFPQVKEYYTLIFAEEGEELVLDRYKEIITNEFFPKRGYGKARLSIAKKAITDFKKISSKPSLLIDIMLHYVDQGVAYTDQYGDIDGPFYESMEKMFEDALKLAEKYNYVAFFQEICEEIVNGACEGWGFKDSLATTFNEVFDTDIT